MIPEDHSWQRNWYLISSSTGAAEEALEFYKGVFGGSYEMMRVKDTPVASEMPPDAANSVMHASFTADEIKFFASDGATVKPVDHGRRQHLARALVRRRRARRARLRGAVGGRQGAAADRPRVLGRAFRDGHRQVRQRMDDDASVSKKVTPFLWFDGQAEEAANFYVSVFENAKINQRRAR